MAILFNNIRNLGGMEGNISDKQYFSKEMLNTSFSQLD